MCARPRWARSWRACRRHVRRPRGARAGGSSCCGGRGGTATAAGGRDSRSPPLPALPPHRGCSRSAPAVAPVPDLPDGSLATLFPGTKLPNHHYSGLPGMPPPSSSASGGHSPARMRAPPPLHGRLSLWHPRSAPFKSTDFPNLHLIHPMHTRCLYYCRNRLSRF